MNSPIDPVPILKAVFDGYALDPWGVHGLVHWARVWENGLRIAEASGGDLEIAALFALLHDARRVNDHDDPGHGGRGADLAEELRGASFELDDVRFALLHDACTRHTDGHVEAHPAIQACWDADRLDLGRVGVRIKPHRLCTDAARKLVPWADERSRAEHRPALVEHWSAALGIPRPGARSRRRFS